MNTEESSNCCSTGPPEFCWVLEYEPLAIYGQNYYLEPPTLRAHSTGTIWKYDKNLCALRASIDKGRKNR